MKKEAIENMKSLNRWEELGVENYVKENLNLDFDVCGGDEFGLNIDTGCYTEREELRGIGLTQGNDLILQFYVEDAPVYYWAHWNEDKLTLIED